MRKIAENYYLGYNDDDSITADELIDTKEPEYETTGILDVRGKLIYKKVRETVKFGFVP